MRTIKDQVNVIIGTVLSENSERYTSTTVSGGGSRPSGNSVSIDPIQSEVHHHANQNIFLRLEDGKEQRVRVRGKSVALRPGHVVACVYHARGGDLLRVINYTTDEVWTIAYPTKVSSAWLKINTFFLSMLRTIPVFSYATFFQGWWIKRDKLFFDNARETLVKRNRVPMIATLLGIATFWGFIWEVESRESLVPLCVVSFLFKAIPCAIVFMGDGKVQIEEMRQLQAFVDELAATKPDQLKAAA